MLATEQNRRAEKWKQIKQPRRMKQLTVKQENFCMAVAEGKSNIDALRSSYGYKETVTTSTLHQRAYQLSSNPHIRDRIAELRQLMADRNLWTREQSVVELVKALHEARTTMEKVACIKELNLMHGYNQPIKVELGVRQLPASVDDFV